MTIKVYTDGSATVSTKPGGYGWVIVIDGKKHSEGNGHIELATNNDAELKAAIQGLVAAYKLLTNEVELVALPSVGTTYEVILCSDSQIVLGWANGNYRFKQEDKKSQYEILSELVRRLNVTTEWVEGHAGHEFNERADELANLGRLNLGPNDKLPSKKHPKSRKNSSEIKNRTETVVCLWYKNVLKVIDLSANVIEDHDETLHGPRDSQLEVK
jgi:ribonuclease HI